MARGTLSYAVDISTLRGASAADFDGVIYSTVVATRRHLIKCITEGCRSTQRRCHHAYLVRKLDRLGEGRGDDGDSSDVSSDSDDWHVVRYDSGEDCLSSLRKSDDAGHVLLFTWSFCDGLLSFVYNSRSSYSAATSFLASLRSNFRLRRQLIVLLVRCFVATLQPTPEHFVRLK